MVTYIYLSNNTDGQAIKQGNIGVKEQSYFGKHYGLM
jgi:hypothetical protein